MKLQISHPLVLFFLLHILTLTPQTQSRNSNNKQNKNLLSKTCKLTKQYHLCLQTLNLNPKSKNATNVWGLAQISLGIALNEANNTLHFVVQLFTNTSDPMLYRLYGTCLEEYGKAVAIHIPEAITAFGIKNNYGAAKQGVVDAGADVHECNYQLTGHSPVVSRRNIFMRTILDVTVQIISLVR